MKSSWLVIPFLAFGSTSLGLIAQERGREGRGGGIIRGGNVGSNGSAVPNSPGVGSFRSSGIELGAGSGGGRLPTPPTRAQAPVVQIPNRSSFPGLNNPSSGLGGLGSSRSPGVPRQSSQSIVPLPRSNSPLPRSNSPLPPVQQSIPRASGQQSPGLLRSNPLPSLENRSLGMQGSSLRPPVTVLPPSIPRVSRPEVSRPDATLPTEPRPGAIGLQRPSTLGNPPIGTMQARPNLPTARPRPSEVGAFLGINRLNLSPGSSGVSVAPTVPPSTVPPSTVTPNVPKHNPPSIGLPRIDEPIVIRPNTNRPDRPNIDRPNIDRLQSNVGIPKIELPKVDRPRLEFPNIDRPSNTAGLDLPNLANLPNNGILNVPRARLPDPSVINIGNSSVINTKPAWVHVDPNRVANIHQNWRTNVISVPSFPTVSAARQEAWRGCGTQVRQQWWGDHHHHQWFGPDWWLQHRHRFCGWHYYHRFPQYDWVYWWSVPTFNTFNTWFTWSAPAQVWARPVLYDYGVGGNVVLDNDLVFINGQQVCTQQEFSESAALLATVDPPADEAVAIQEEWMPLGTFAITAGENDVEPSRIIQLAVSKSGIISGTVFNIKTDQAYTVQGQVDKETQRVAFRIGDSDEVVVETGLYNLTQDETPILIHFGTEKVESFMLIRLKTPEDISAQE